MRRWWSGIAVWLAAGCIVPAPYGDQGGDDTDDTEESDTVPEDTLTGIRVLILDDGGSSQEVSAALEAAGHEVKASRLYTEWTGSNPALDDVDVVVFLQGRTFAEGFSGDGVLVQYVLDGGGLVRTERSSYAATVPPTLSVDAGLPVEYVSGPLEATTWRVVDRTSPLVEGLATQWEDPGGYAKVRAKAGTHVVIDKQGGDPLVVWDDTYGGTVVYINHDMTATSSRLTGAMATLLGNAVTFAAP